MTKAGDFVVCASVDGDEAVIAITGKQGEESAHNARLIAAAPELLAALRIIMELRSELWSDPEGPTYAELVRFSNDVVSLARPAIAKAEGGEK